MWKLLDFLLLLPLLQRVTIREEEMGCCSWTGLFFLLTFGPFWDFFLSTMDETLFTA